mmetsp:Transcript_72272/g.167477  ORF Transcript_72272/g.167477 Transcript_72272/m.167477 type:complete len:179 (+) Transcript_72272:118-654(+)
MTKAHAAQHFQQRVLVSLNPVETASIRDPGAAAEDVKLANAWRRPSHHLAGDAADFGRMQEDVLAKRATQAPMTPEMSLEQSVPSLPHMQRERPLQILEAKASNSIGNKQIAAAAMVCRNSPVRMACTMDRATEREKTKMWYLQLPPFTIGDSLVPWNRTRSLSTAKRLGNARITHAR